MRKVSLRLPDDLVAAYDAADGSRSAVMRRRLAEAVEGGELSGVDDDLKTLAGIEAAKDRGRLTRRRGTFRERCYAFFGEKWKSGAVTPDDADDMAESWRHEAALFGPEYVAFVEAIIGWFREQWTVETHRPGFPEATVFLARSDPDAIDVSERLIEVLQDGKDRGYSRQEAIDRAATFHARSRVEKAAAHVWERSGGGSDA